MINIENEKHYISIKIKETKKKIIKRGNSDIILANNRNR